MYRWLTSLFRLTRTLGSVHVGWENLDWSGYPEPYIPVTECCIVSMVVGEARKIWLSLVQKGAIRAMEDVKRALKVPCMVSVSITRPSHQDEGWQESSSRYRRTVRGKEESSKNASNHQQHKSSIFYNASTEQPHDKTYAKARPTCQQHVEVDYTTKY